MMKKNYILCLIVGFLSGFGFAPYSCILLLFLTYSLFFYAFMKARNKRQMFLCGFCFGFGIGAMSMSWLVHALLIDNGAFAWLVPVVPLGFGLLFGLFFGLPALLCWRVNHIFARVLAFAGWLCIFEWIRSWLFTGFPWNLTGSVWTAWLPVLQTASVTGVYGLSLFSIIWFAVPFLIYKKQYVWAAIDLSTFAFIAIFGFLRCYEMTHEYVWGVQLRLVQPNIEQTLKWDDNAAEENFMQHIRLSKSKNHEKITHVLWSETASPYPLDVSEDARAMTISAVRQNGTLITGSLRVADKSKKQLANSVFVLNDMGEIESFYDKSHLVPFGEYVPLRNILPFDKIVPIGSDIKEGSGVKTIRIPNAPPAGMLVCYEVIFPHQVVDRTQPRPKWLINVTNDGWYGDSAGPYQHLASAQMRAVEEGLPLVRVAGTGISAIIYPWGEIMSSLPLNTQGVLDGSLPKALDSITIYARLGNSIPLILSLLCIVFALILNKKST